MKFEDITAGQRAAEEEYCVNVFDLASARKTNVVEEQTPCRGCGGLSFVEVIHSGHVACVQCGEVMEERLISNDQEYHIFEGDDDAEKKIRVSGSFNIKSNHDFVGTNQRQLGGRDENEFLRDGLRDIEHGLRRVLRNGRNARAESRAKEIFRVAYDWMFLQKKGINKIMDRDTAADSAVPETALADDDPAPGTGFKRPLPPGVSSATPAKLRKKRHNFGRRKAFVVGSLLLALREQGVQTTVQDLNQVVDGAWVNEQSVLMALRDIGMLARNQSVAP